MTGPDSEGLQAEAVLAIEDHRPQGKPERRRRWAFNSRFLIGKPGNPMMERWRLIQTPLFGIYAHFIYREDLDPVPHDRAETDDQQPCTSCEEPMGNPDTFCDACKLSDLEDECDRLRAEVARVRAEERQRIEVGLQEAFPACWAAGTDATIEHVRHIIAAGSAVPVRAMQFEQEARGLAAVATPTEPGRCRHDRVGGCGLDGITEQAEPPKDLLTALQDSLDRARQPAEQDGQR